MLKLSQIYLDTIGDIMYSRVKMPRRSSQHSMRQVAELAGVSVATVSNLLSNNKRSNIRVSEKTRERVLKVLQQVRYEPNIHAKRLFSKQSKVLNLVFPPSEKRLPEKASLDYNLAGIIQGVTSAASELGYQVILNSTGENFFTNSQHLQLYRSRAVDGFLVLGVGYEDLFIAEMAQEKIPFVMLQTVVRNASELGYAYVVSDSHKGALQLTDYIISLGHRTIGCIRGFQSSSVGYERWKGFCDSMTAHEIYRQNLVFDGDYTYHSGYTGAEELLSRNKDITAVVCSNNLMAAGAFKYITEQGMKVPEDISITGYDGIGNCMIQPLTSSNDPIHDIGYIASKKLIQFLQTSIDTTIPDFQITLEPELYIGTTTANPRDNSNGTFTV